MSGAVPATRAGRTRVALRRVSRPFVFLLLLLTLVAWTELSAAVATEYSSSKEAELYRLVNVERTERGLKPLTTSAALRTVARRHSQRMLFDGTIFHNEELREEVEVLFPSWASIAENVGVGPTIPSVHRAFMESPGHRANVLADDMDHVGIGVVAGGRLFMTENFLRQFDGTRNPAPSLFRLSGNSRIDTAQVIADTAFTPGSARGAVLAPSGDFHGALAGAVLAGVRNGPVVLSGTDRLDDAAAAALTRALGTNSDKPLYVVGGPFSERVLVAAREVTSRVHVVGGADHVATAAAVAAALPRKPDVAFITTVTDYPDALAVSAVSAATGWPVLYTHPGRLSEGTATALRTLGVRRTHIVGGAGAVSRRVANQLAAVGAPAATRLRGASRIETALAIADFGLRHGLQPRHVQLATAHNFPDALAGGAVGAAMRAPVVLTASNRLHPAVAAWLRARRPDIAAVHLLGGPGALSRAVERDVQSALR